MAVGLISNVDVTGPLAALATLIVVNEGALPAQIFTAPEIGLSWVRLLPVPSF